MSQKICLFKTLTVLNGICSRFKYRIVIFPLIFIGMLGFAVNHSIITFTYSALDYCQPKTNIVFLKTHKCAGSTIQNILMRYGDVHNLTFVLPHTSNYLGIGRGFDKKFVDRPHFPVYNILAHHTILNYKAIKEFMPSNSVFITIVRNPVQLFESSFVYYNMNRIYGLDIHNFSQLSPIHNQTFLLQRFNSRIGINQMVYDLGANPRMFYNHSFMKHYVDKLESQFHLVLVTERMDESLILLKHLLCWDVDDVVAFKVNARNPKFKSNLTEDEIKNLELINSADMILYKRFLGRFERQVKDFGVSRMRQEISELKAKRNIWSELCVQEVQGQTKPLKSKEYVNPYVMRFERRKDVNNATCMSLVREEINYTELLRRKQRLRLPVVKPRKYLARQPKLSKKIRRRL